MTSSRLKQAAFAPFTSEVLLPLVTISGSGFDPIPIVPNNEEVTSGGVTYSPFPLTLQLPDDDSTGVPVMKFTVTSIAPDVMQRLRLVSDALFVDVIMVLFSDPETVELQFPTMRLRNVSYDAMTISGDLVIGDFLTEAVPAHSFTPGFAPAVFRG